MTVPGRNLRTLAHHALLFQTGFSDGPRTGVLLRRESAALFCARFHGVNSVTEPLLVAPSFVVMLDGTKKSTNGKS